MNNDELNFINNILDDDDDSNLILEDTGQYSKTLDQVQTDREEALLTIYYPYINYPKNEENLKYYLSSLADYQYVDDVESLKCRDVICYPDLQNEENIYFKYAMVMTTTPYDKYGKLLSHLIRVCSFRYKDTGKGIWYVSKEDSIIFRKITKNDEDKMLIAELLSQYDLT